MSAVLAMEEEQPRLYARASRLPIDWIAPQHAEIHAELERWGAWNRIRRQAATCGSVEKNFDGRGGYRSNYYPALPISLPENQRNRQVDRAVIRLPLQHRETVKLFYVSRREPRAICRAAVIHWNDFPKWMFDCRAMVLTQLRALSI